MENVIPLKVVVEKDDTYGVTSDDCKFKIHTFDAERLKLKNDNIVYGVPFYYRPKYLGIYDGRIEVGTMKKEIRET